MRFEHIVAYCLRDLTPAAATPDVPVPHGLGGNVTVTLTADVDRHTHAIDQEAAARMTRKSGLGFRKSGLQPAPGETPLQAEVRWLQTERKKACGASAYCVVKVVGVAKGLDASDRIDHEQFSFLRDAADKDVLKRQDVGKVTSVFAALCVLRDLENVSRVADGIVFYDGSDRKPVYSVSFGMGTPRASVATSNIGDLSELEVFIPRLERDSKLTRISRLLLKGLDLADDRLGAFVYLWASMEMLVEGIYSRYKSIALTALGDFQNPLPEARAHGLRAALDDEQRLRSKFLVVAAALFPNDLDERAKVFRSIQEMRNDMAHRGDFDLATLPIDGTARLIRNLLAAHLRFSENNQPSLKEVPNADHTSRYARRRRPCHGTAGAALRG